MLSTLISGLSAEKTNETNVVNLNQQPKDSWYINHLNRFSSHNDVYFLYGFDSNFAKLQLSFKYRIIQQLYASYTILLLWDLNDSFGTKSVPFAEITHNPELFYQFKFDLNKTKFLDFIRIGIYEHISNGEDNGVIKTNDGEDEEEETITNLTTIDDKSRSIDSSYISFNLVFPLIKDRLKLSWEHKYFLIYRTVSRYQELRNIDPKAGLYNIFGWYKYTLTLDWQFDKKGHYFGAFYWKFYNGGDAFIDEKFAFELGLKIKLLIKKVPIGFFFQYFNGFTEGLILDYRNLPVYYIGGNTPRYDSFRVGLVF